MGIVTRTKDHLSTINKKSWHYRLTKRVWRQRLENNTRKACFYWWIRVPLALICAGLFWVVAVPVVVALMIAFLVISIPIGYFLGFTTMFVKDVKDPDRKRKVDLFYSYKYSPRTGRQKRIAPYQIVLPIVGAWTLYRMSLLIADHPAGSVHTAKWSVLTLSVLGFLALIGLAVYWRRGKLAELWDKACPTVTFVAATSEGSS